MIDFEQEIEVRLRQFQYLTGKGNVKDCNKTLYEILRLMLGMISQCDEDEEVVVSDITPTVEAFHRVPVVEAEGSEEDEEIEGDHASISSDDLDHVPSDPAPLKSAPHGLTKFGNPRRIRNRKPKA